MKKRIIITGLGILLIFSMAACSGEIQLGFPTADVEPGESAPLIEVPAINAEQAPASGSAATGSLDAG